jgi:signal transduction protein with GAF and PtsI domain
MVAPLAYGEQLRVILETAAHVIDSTTASVSTVDEERGELVIQRALGPGAQQAEGLRVPLGHGVAGLVAATGQPMAISNARSDPRHAAEIAEQTGYQPNTILCVPLLDDGEVVGVLELMDKGGGRSFTTDDMETASLFAEQAALLLEQSRAYTSLGALMSKLLSGSSSEGGVATDAARAFATALEDAPAYHQTVELAELVQRLASQGEHERRLCAAVLRSLLEYASARPQPGLTGRIE